MTAKEASESGLAETCSVLLQAVRPDMYRRNAFRVTGLSVESTTRDLSRHAEKVRMMQKFGGAPAEKTIMALTPPPDDEAIRDALHRLHDPENRLVDEFFWFWPHQLGQGRTDEVLTQLARDGVEQVARRWSQMEKSSEGLASMHNLAVLFHCLALDWEQTAQTRTLTQSEESLIDAYWQHAFLRWKAVLEQEAVWHRLTARIRALEDPRLTTGLSRRMRSSLPLALLSVNATLAVRYAEALDLRAARRHLAILSWWENSDGERTAASAGSKHGKSPADGPSPLGPLAQQAVVDALQPIRQRIKSICKNADDRTDREPSQGDEAARDILSLTAPLLKILDDLLPAGSPIADVIHDEIANQALVCVIAFGNKTDNWVVGTDLLEKALAIARGEATRDRIQENLTIMRNNLVYATCWFCNESPAHVPSALPVKMYGEVERKPIPGGTRLEWRPATIQVPRCKSCRAVHERGNVFLGLLLTAAFVIAIGVPIALGVVGILSGGWAFLAGLAGVFVLPTLFAGIGALINKMRQPKNVKPIAAKNNFPRIKQMLSEGWQFGEKPTS